MTNEDLVNWRRSKVAEYLAMGHNQTEIAKILKVSEPTISRDVDYLRQEASKAMSAYLDDLPLQHQKARWTVDLILRECFKMLENCKESSDKLDALKLILQATQVRLSFLSVASALNKALEYSNSLKEEIDRIKKSQQEIPKPKFEVVESTDDNGEKVRRAKKIKKVKDSDKIIV